MLMPGCPPDLYQGRPWLDPVALVLHRSYGFYPGDYAVIRRGGLAHVLIGKAPGEWVQTGDTNAQMWHCNGANRAAVGWELTGVNEDGLSGWQIDKLGYSLDWLRDAHGIAKVYLDPASVPPASVWVNGGGYRGGIAHYNVATDDGSAQHSDLVTMFDWSAAAGWVVPGEEDQMVEFGTNPNNRNEVWASDGTWRRHVGPTEWGFRVAFQQAKAVAWDGYWFDKLVDVNALADWMKQQTAVVNAHTDLAVAGITGGGGVTEEQVRAVVRAELDATKLTG